MFNPYVMIPSLILQRKFKFSIMHRYTLEPYKGMKTRYTCPACNHRKTFTRYTDHETNNHLAEHVGRCSREVKCGYHYKPAQFFKDNGSPLGNTYTYRALPPRAAPSFIPPELAIHSFCNYNDNNFVQFLISRFGKDDAMAAVKQYHIGTSRYWRGATVFWQADASRYVRTGKIMLYNRDTGKRVKQPYSHINWAHRVLQLKDFELMQCLFGEHLLHTGSAWLPKTKEVAIVESEKTAVIASIYLPQFTWLACGSLTNLTYEKCKVLRGLKVTLFPDLNCYHKWRTRAKELSVITTFHVSGLLEVKATDQEKASGLDLADYLLRFDVTELREQGLGSESRGQGD